MVEKILAPPPTALLIIDSQQGFEHASHWGPQRSNPSYEKNITTLLSTFRSLPSRSLIIHVSHSSLSLTSPLHPSNPGFQFYSFSSPQEGELTISKQVNSAFIGTNLEAVLREHSIARLYICGLTTDHCVSTTSRMASNLGVCGAQGDVVLVEDATACWRKPEGRWDAETVHAVHVESLREFLRIAVTLEVLEEVKADVKHSR